MALTLAAITSVATASVVLWALRRMLTCLCAVNEGACVRWKTEQRCKLLFMSASEGVVDAVLGRLQLVSEACIAEHVRRDLLSHAVQFMDIGSVMQRVMAPLGLLDIHIQTTLSDTNLNSLLLCAGNNRAPGRN